MLVMRLVTRESSKNEPRNELDSLVTSLAASLDSMSVPQHARQLHLHARVAQQVDGLLATKDHLREEIRTPSCKRMLPTVESCLSA